MARQRKASLADELAALQAMDVAALREKWQELYGVPAPRHSRQDFLMRACAYRIQEQAVGGLRPATRRRLKELTAEFRAGATPKLKAAPRTSVGTRLVREWNGVTHMVEVGESGYLWRGQTWRSLSVIAREITGARWSGPRFFGLKAS